MWVEEHIYSVKAKSQTGNIWVKDNGNTQRLKLQDTQLGILKVYAFCWKNSAEDLGSSRECCWVYLSVYENTPEKFLHLPPKSYHSFT